MKVGCRVQVGSYYGLIRYLGPVDGTEGEWVGVEWDDEGRGKHNGTHNDKQYFSCAELQGSFVRPHKLHAGVSFSDMLAARYTDVSGQGGEMNILNKDNSSTRVELIGLSQADINRAAYLENLVMREESISSIGDVEYIRAGCTGSVNLDLSLNLFSELSDIITLLFLMPKLECIHLKGNVLGVSSVPECTVQHTSLTRVYLAGTGLSWHQLSQFAAFFPNLQEIYISGSALTLGEVAPNTFPSLKCMDLQNSGLTRWDELAPLATLGLQSLIVSNNSIVSIAVQEGEWAQLECISLDNNQVSTWESVAELRKLASLRTLRMRSNPLITGPALDMRLLIVAMLPDVTKLNGTPVSANERLQADFLYMKHFAQDYYRSIDAIFTTTKESFESLHPRWPQLMKEYGEPAKEKPVITSIKQQAILVKLQCGDKEYEKKLLKTTLIKNVQLIIQRLTKIPPKDQQLSWTDEDGEVRDLDDPSRALEYYDIIQDCIIVVST